MTKNRHRFTIYYESENDDQARSFENGVIDFITPVTAVTVVTAISEKWIPTASDFPPDWPETQALKKDS